MIALRLIHLGKTTLWYDEACTYITITFHDYLTSKLCLFPPLYYAVLDFLTRLFGCAEWLLRFPSLVCNCVSGVVLYKLGRLLFSHRIALGALIIFAFSPFQIWYAQEATVYAAEGAAYSLAVYFFYKWRIQKRNIFLVHLILASVVAVSIDYVMFVMLLPIIGFIFKKLRYGQRILCLVLVGMGAGLVALNWQYIYSRLYANISWIAPVQIWAIPVSFSNFFTGYLFSPRLDIGVLLVLTMCHFITIYICLRDKKTTLFGLIYIPPALIYLVSVVFLPCYLDRKLFAIAPLVYLVTSYALWSLKRMRWVFTIAICAGMFIGSYKYYFGTMPVAIDQKSYYAHNTFNVGVLYRHDWRRIIDHVRDEWQEGDALLFSDFTFRGILYYYSRQLQWHAPAYIAFDSVSLAKNPFEMQQLVNREYAGFDHLYALYNGQPASTRINTETKLRVIARTLSALQDIHAIDLPPEKRTFLTFLQTHREDVLRVTLSRYDEGTDFFAQSVLIDKNGLDDIKAKRYWLISSSFDRQPCTVSDSAKAVQGFMRSTHKRTFSSWMDGVLVERYEVVQ